MSPALVYARASLRRRWRASVALVLLVAFAGGATIAVAAGARRTSSAFSRFLSEQNAADVFVFATASGLDPDRVRALPDVADVATALAVPTNDSDFATAVLNDPRFGRDINRFKLLEGRLPAPDHPDEAVVGFLLSQRFHIHAGDTVTVHLPEAFTFRVVGVEAAPGEFPPRSSTTNLPIFVSGSFPESPAGRAFFARQDDGFREIVVRLRPGSSPDEFAAAVRSLSDEFVGLEFGRDQAAEVTRSSHAQAVVLWVVAALVALASLFLLAQLLQRDAAEDSDSNATMRSLGMTRAQLVLSSAVRVLVLALTGAAGAALLSWLLSPLFPLGTVRIAEPAPGLSFDAWATTVGAIATVLAVTSLGVLAIERALRRSARASAGAVRPSRLRSFVFEGALPPATGLGARMVLDPGRGRRAIPVRATIVAAVVGIGSIATAFTLGASLQHLLGTPRLYGVTYDAHLEALGSYADVRPLADVVRQDPTVAGIVVASSGIPLASNGVTFGAVSIEGSTDVFAPTLLDGRLPVASDEIALGTRTMSELGVGIGDTIPVAVAAFTDARPLRVVGRAVMAPIADTQRLGRGAILPEAALEAFAALLPADSAAPPPGDAFVTFRDGVDADAGIAALRERLGPDVEATVTPPERPNDVAAFADVQELPSILAVCLGAVAALAVAHLLVSSVRRRRRDLAICKALGFVPRQVIATVGWQATIVTVIALVVGIPAGIVVGRVLWMLLSNWVGVVAQPTVPPWILVVAPAALLLANAVAIVPGLAAARTLPNRVLRAD